MSWSMGDYYEKKMQEMNIAIEESAKEQPKYFTFIFNNENDFAKFKEVKESLMAEAQESTTGLQTMYRRDGKYIVVFDENVDQTEFSTECPEGYFRVRNTNIPFKEGKIEE